MKPSCFPVFRLRLPGRILLLTVMFAWPSMRMLCAQRTSGQRIPVAVDLDIGGDIDDAFALALLLKSNAVDIRAVTTVSADTVARARIAAKMLALAGGAAVPVAAGVPGPGEPFAQARWAADFRSPKLVQTSAVELLDRVIRIEQGRLVLIALGPLTNVAALLKRHPEDRGKIKQIVLMGGSIAHGYQPGSGPTPEYNIAADAPAAQAVFAAGIPLLMAPLDVTAALQLDTAHRRKLFARGTALTNALQALYQLWGQSTPTLHDPMAAALLLHPGICRLQPLHVEVSAEGMTRVVAGGTPNVEVAVATSPANFIRYYESVFASRKE